jgi:cation/acetate symporter
LLSADTFTKVYGLPAEMAWAPFSQPGIVTIPLSFLTLIVVSLATRGGGGKRLPVAEGPVAKASVGGSQ